MAPHAPDRASRETAHTQQGFVGARRHAPGCGEPVRHDGAGAGIGQGEQPWVVLADPEGNEFCVLSSGSS